MNKFRKTVMKLTVCGVALFAFGIFIGYQLNYGMLSSIQGYLFAAAGEASDSNATNSNATNSNATNSNATNSNATNSNATNSNATNSNATNSNATNANATSANAIWTDYIIYLQHFALDSSSVEQGGNVKVAIETSGACNSAVSIVFTSETGISFTVQVQDLTGDPYIVIPESTVATKYEVTDVVLFGKNSDNTTFTRQYSVFGMFGFDFNSWLTVTEKTVVENNTTEGKPTEDVKNASENDNNQQNIVDVKPVSKVKLNSISFNDTSAKVGDKAYFDIQSSEKLSSLKLVFNSSNGKVMTVYGKNLNTNRPYIEIPSSTVSGNYSLVSAILSASNSATAYSSNGGNDTERFAFNSTLEISDGTETTFIYNNEDVNSEVLNKLYNAPDGSEFTINVNSNTLINQELFNTIKGKNKKLIINYNDNQIIFNGSDIDNVKTIDVAMTVDNVSNKESINKLVSNGMVVTFPNNGNLPGSALIRVKANDKVSSILGNTVSVYVYNESTNDFCIIDEEVTKTSDGYYEFSISHNSDYLIANEKLDSKLVVSESSDNVVSFQKGNLTLLMLIIIGVIIIIGAVVVVVVLNKKDNVKDKK